jgi:soluble lytic murein transglycosylase-like protein
MKAPYVAALCALLIAPAAGAKADQASLQSLISQHAAQNNVPEALVHRIVRRESNYNPGAVGRGGALGLMQIKYATARGMGYAGAPSGLLDANTNLTYAVRYLAGAYRVADGNLDRAVSYYANGFYYAAKRHGLSGLTTAQAPAVQHVAATVEVTGSLPAATNSATGPAWSLADMR